MHFQQRWTWTVAVVAVVALASAAVAVAGDESAPRRGGLVPAPSEPLVVGFGPFTPGGPPEAPPLLLAAEKGGYRFHIIGPDGRVYAHQVIGGMSSEQLDRVKARLKELQAAAGDPEAVQRISRELLQELTTQEEDSAALEEKPHYGIGISLASEVPAVLRAHLKLGAEEGLLVASVAPGSPAEQAGVKEYDILLKVGDRPLTKPTELIEAVQQAGQESQPVKLELLSGGERRAVEVTPTKSAEIVWKVSGLPEGKVKWDVTAEPFTGKGQLFIHKIPPGIAPPLPGTPFGAGYPPNKSPIGDDAVKKLEERIRALEDRLSKLAAQEERPVKEKEAAPPPTKTKEGEPPRTKEPEPTRTKEGELPRTKEPATTPPK